MSHEVEKNIGEKKHQKRVKKVQIIMGLSAAVGLPFGVLIGRIAKGSLEINPILLIIILTVLVLAFVFLTLAWYKEMDEFERQGFHESGNIAFHSGIIALPWFVLHDQGLVPPLDGAWLIVFMSIVFCVALIAKNGLNFK